MIIKSYKKQLLEFVFCLLVRDLKLILTHFKPPIFHSRWYLVHIDSSLQLSPKKNGLFFAASYRIH